MKFEPIEYSTIREDYCIYEIENGQVLRTKVTITSIGNEINENTNEKKGKMSFSNVTTVDNPAGIDASNLEYSPTDKVTENDVVKELDFTPKKEVINIYETNKMLILISSKVTKVGLTNKRDDTNAPILRFTNDVGVQSIEKSSLNPKIASEKKNLNKNI